MNLVSQKYRDFHAHGEIRFFDETCDIFLQQSYDFTRSWNDTKSILFSIHSQLILSYVDLNSYKNMSHLYTRFLVDVPALLVLVALIIKNVGCMI